MNIFGLFDYFKSNISLPLGTLGASIAVGWLWKKQGAVAEVSNNGELGTGVANGWFFLVKWVVPVFVFIIFLKSIGVF